MITKDFFDSLSKKQKSLLTGLITTVDKEGNRYGFDSESQSVILRKPNTDRRLDIGKIGMQRNKIVYLKHCDSSKHLFHTLDAWGINYHVLKHVEGVQVIADNKTSYKILAENAHKWGQFMNFKNQKAELQLFIPRKHWYVEEWT